MRTLLHTLRNVWCRITGDCPVTPPDDPYLSWLQDQERDAYVEAGKSRQRQAHIPTHWADRPLTDRFRAPKRHEGGQE